MVCFFFKNELKSNLKKKNLNCWYCYFGHGCKYFYIFFLFLAVSFLKKKFTGIHNIHYFAFHSFENNVHTFILLIQIFYTIFFASSGKVSDFVESYSLSQLPIVESFVCPSGDSPTRAGVPYNPYHSLMKQTLFLR